MQFGRLISRRETLTSVFDLKVTGVRESFLLVVELDVTFDATFR